MVKAQKIQMMLKPVQPVMVRVKYACSKVSSRYSKPVALVVVRAKSSRTHVKNVMVRGVSDRQQTLEVTIPAGVDNGDRVRLTGKGEAIRDGQSGDLYVEVVVREHEIFQRDGADLYMDVPVSIADAALGKEIEIPTLDGRVSLKVPEGTQTGKLFRLRGKGVKPVRTSMQGDLLCRIVVETPVNLTARQRELLKELQTTMEGEGSQSSPKKKSFFDRLFD